jgi:GTP-binding protein EngB required for normal cell division
VVRLLGRLRYPGALNRLLPEQLQFAANFWQRGAWTPSPLSHITLDALARERAARITAVDWAALVAEEAQRLRALGIDVGARSRWPIAGSGRARSAGDHHRADDGGAAPGSCPRDDGRGDLMDVVVRRNRAALVGNPNAGKSALFNALTGARQKIANYPGVTVERKAGRLTLPNGDVIELTDLPGSYGLAATSPDEEVTRRVILGELPGEVAPDVLIVVLDASNLEQHLVFAQEVIALGRPVVVALNMIDLAERDGLVIDPSALSQTLGVPVIPTVAVRRRGLTELTAAIAEAEAHRSPSARPPRFGRAPDGGPCDCRCRNPVRKRAAQAAFEAGSGVAASLAGASDPVHAAVHHVSGGVLLG